MTCEHVKELIQELHPNVTVRQLTLAAGLDPNRIAYYLKPSTHIDQMPKAAAMKEIARALGCDFRRVVEAFAADVGLPWGPADDETAELRREVRRYQKLAPEADDPDLRRLARRYRELGPRDRVTLQRVAQSLNGGA